MEHYVTLFDSLFLPQGLALHLSMERNAGPFTLWVLCLDDVVYETLKKKKLVNVRLIKLADVETDELRAVKPGRSKAEYCWTLTPFAPKFVFEQNSAIERVTYVDADLYFLRDPAPIFEEFDATGKCVLITDHGYAPEYDLSETNGQFCVQFMTFIKGQSEVVRSWWADSCLEWCFARCEDGKFGDQKYLDHWPRTFKDQVHVLQQQHFMLAPWNASRYPVGSAIIYHMHSLRILSNSDVRLWTGYSIPNVVVNTIYDKYLIDLKIIMEELHVEGFVVQPQADMNYFRQTISSMRKTISRAFNNLWLFKVKNIK